MTTGLTGAQALLAATRALADAGIPDPGRDARRLFSHALGIEPGRLTLILSDAIDQATQSIFQTLITRRLGREPVSHLTGTRSFYGRDFKVNGAVLDPRPETETLIEAALSLPFDRVLDLGTGSGCILLTLLAEMPGSTGLGIDISAAACEVAGQNAKALGLHQRAKFQLGNWHDGPLGEFDLIVANPPYIALSEMAQLAPEVRDWEPRVALTDEGDGLGAYRAILIGITAHMANGARLIMEIGPTQAEEVSVLVLTAGFQAVDVIQDLDGRDRIVMARQTTTGAEIP
jgi:release factor glutamine methyltransferase